MINLDSALIKWILLFRPNSWENGKAIVRCSIYKSKYESRRASMSRGMYKIYTDYSAHAQSINRAFALHSYIL